MPDKAAAEVTVAVGVLTIAVARVDGHGPQVSFSVSGDWGQGSAAPALVVESLRAALAEAENTLRAALVKEEIEAEKSKAEGK